MSTPRTRVRMGRRQESDHFLASRRTGCAAQRGGHSLSALSLWRDKARRRQLTALVQQSDGLTWNKRLLSVLLDELYADETLAQLIGRPPLAEPGRWAQAVAIAIILRHSWRPDDLENVINRLGLKRSFQKDQHSNAGEPSSPRQDSASASQIMHGVAPRPASAANDLPQRCGEAVEVGFRGVHVGGRAHGLRDAEPLQQR